MAALLSGFSTPQIATATDMAAPAAVRTPTRVPTRTPTRTPTPIPTQAPITSAFDKRLDVAVGGSVDLHLRGGIGQFAGGYWRVKPQANRVVAQWGDPGGTVPVDLPLDRLNYRRNNGYGRIFSGTIFGGSWDLPWPSDPGFRAFQPISGMATPPASGKVVIIWRSDWLNGPNTAVRYNPVAGP
jgi:hypothetical protein